MNLTCLVLAVPVLLDLALDLRHRPFGYLAADAFYYLNIARNWVEFGLPSYDGVRATNGFHPLWQACVALVYGSLRLIRLDIHSPLVVVLVSLGCITLALRLLGRAWVRSEGSIPVAFVLLPIGVYPLAVLYQYLMSYSSRAADGGNEGPMILHGTLYSFVNGMESPLVLLAFCTAAWLHVAYNGVTTSNSALLFGGALSLLCLARLDHTIFVVAPALIWFSQLLFSRGRRRYAAVALLALVLPIGTYLCINRIYAGSFVPVSGSAKSSFPIPLSDGINFIRGVLEKPGKRIDLHTLYRFAPSIVSVILAGGYSFMSLRWVPSDRGWFLELAPWAAKLDRFLLLMTPGVVGLAVYNMLFAWPSAIGHWYQPASLLYDSLVVLRLLAALMSKPPCSWRHGRLFGCIAFGGLAILGFWFCQYRPTYHRMYARFYWDSVPKIRAALKGYVPPIYEMDDGIVAFGLRVPAMSATGLALDSEATRLTRNRRRVDVALERGFRVVGAVYYNSHKLRMGSSEKDAIRWASDTLGETVAGHRAEILYTDDAGTLVKIK